MADIRIKDLATTAASTASDDFIAVDGSANGTRKLNAYSPTFGGNVVATGTLTVNSTTDSSSKDTGAIITEGGLGVEKSATIGGNLTVSGTGTSSVAGSFGVGTASPSQKVEVAQNWNGTTWIKVSNTDTGAGAAAGVLFGNQSGDYGAISLLSSGNSPANAFFLRSLSTNVLTFGTGNTEQMRLATSGNLLVGTTSDTGQKLQVKGGTRITDSASASNYITIGSGNDAPYGNNSVVAQTGTLVMGTVASASLVLYTNATTALTLSSSQNMTVEGTGVHQLKGTVLVGNQVAIGASFDVQTANGTASTFRLFQNGVSNWVWSVPASTDALVLSQYGTTEAMRFDSGRNATFAGTIKPQLAATASAPTYVKGAIYFDTTLNKLRVGGATGWETITSV